MKSLRLHVWPKNPVIQNAGFLIHDHTFSFISFVLCGEVKNDEYRVTEDKNGDQQLFSVEYDQGASLLKPSGVRVDCQLARSSVCKAGKFYSLSAPSYHATTISGNSSAATLVLTTADMGRTAHVIGSGACDETFRCERLPIDKGHVIRNLKELLLKINDGEEAADARNFEPGAPP